MPRPPLSRTRPMPTGPCGPWACPPRTLAPAGARAPGCDRRHPRCAAGRDRGAGAPARAALGGFDAPPLGWGAMGYHGRLIAGAAQSLGVPRTAVPRPRRWERVLVAAEPAPLFPEAGSAPAGGGGPPLRLARPRSALEHGL
jgi:hypothetical protein